MFYQQISAWQAEVSKKPYWNLTILCNSLEGGNVLCGFFLDLSRALDWTNSTVLEMKQKRCGIRSVVLNWFKSFLIRMNHNVNVKDISTENFQHEGTKNIT